MKADKNTIIGFVLMAAVLMGFMFYSRKQSEKQAVYDKRQAIEQTEKDSQKEKRENADKEKQDAKLQEEKSDSTNALFAANHGKPGSTTIENEFLSVVVSNKGGQIESVKFKDSTYKNQQGGNVTLFDKGDSEFSMVVNGKENKINTTDFYFTPNKLKKDSLTMSLPVADGSLDITYSLVPNSYILKMDVKANGIEDFFPSKTSSMSIVWNEDMKQQEKGKSFETRYSTITYRTVEGSTDELSSLGGDKEKDDFDKKAKWITYKTQFFSQVLIAKNSLKVEKMSSVQKDTLNYLKTFNTKMSADFDPTGAKATSFALYLGPNKFTTLSDNEDKLKSDTDLDLRSLVYLGWPIVRWINRYFILYLFDWMTGWGLNMGIVLLILTIFIKCLVFPLMKKSYLSSARMRVLRPKIEEITKKYTKPEDAMQKQQETMKLYSEYGVSPMGGCLPMLIQMPVWIALFNFIPNAIELRGQSFLWASDLSTYDDVIHWGKDIWMIGDHLSLFCVLWCVATVASSMFSMRQQQDSMTPDQQKQMGMMKWMTYLMPLIFFFSFNSYSSGLNYYYFISSLTSVLLMWYLRKSTDDAKLLKQLEERHKIRKQQTANGKKPTSMMERLQAMQEKQMEMLKKQKEEQAARDRQNK